MEPMRHKDVKGFNGCIFRRTAPQIRNPGGLWDESAALYPLLGGRSSETVLEWDWSSGAKMKFAALQYDSDVEDWQGSAICYLGFDELTHFGERAFFYMLSRNRSTCGIRPYLRATCNPDPESWVARFIAWWIDQETGYPIAERSGVLRWFVRLGDQFLWRDTQAELVALIAEMLPDVKADERPVPKSVTFIPAKLTDNRILMKKDPGYLANLMALPQVERARLLDGNWKVVASAGKVFNRAWFEVVDAVPRGGEECRGWDFAATEKQVKGSKAEARKQRDPDYTAGVKVRLVHGVYYILDCTFGQWGPDRADEVFTQTTTRDAMLAHAAGTTYRVRWPIDPGSAGVRDNQRLLRLIPGVRRRGVRSTGDKLTRVRALAVEAEAGLVKLLRGPWNEAFLSHLHGQPDLPHDDIMDAVGEAFNDLYQRQSGRAAAGGQRATLSMPSRAVAVRSGAVGVLDEKPVVSGHRLRDMMVG